MTRYDCADASTVPNRFAGYILDGAWFLDGSFFLEAWPATDPHNVDSGLNRFACADVSVVPSRYTCVP